MNEEQLAELKQEVEAINKAVETIRDNGISWQALYLLVQQAAPTVSGKKIPIRTIRAVFDGFEALQEFVFPQDDDE